MAAHKQTKIQERLRIDAAQPYVWVDVRGSETQGQMFELVLANTGPTIAHNVCATIEPPLLAGKTYDGSREEAQRRLAEDINALPPGRRVAWSVGIGWDILGDEGSLPEHTVTSDAGGPFGPVPQLVYPLNLAGLRETRGDLAGSLHYVRKAVDTVTSRLSQHGRPFSVHVMSRDD